MWTNCVRPHLGRTPGRIPDSRRTFHLNNLGPKPHASRRITNTDPIRHRWLAGDRWRGLHLRKRSCMRGCPGSPHARRRAGEDGAVVGYDTRFISDRFAAAVAEVLADSGIATYLFSRPRSHSGRKPCHHDAKRGRRGDHHCEPQPRRMERI